jgi:hypothetical protein
MLRRGEGWSGRRGSNPRPTAWKAVTLPLSYSRAPPATFPLIGPPSPPASARQPSLKTGSPSRSSLACLASEGWWGGEGSNLRSPKAAGLQPAAIDRSATSPKYISCCVRARLLWISAPVSSETVGRCPQACTCHWSPRVRCIPEGRRNRPWSWRRDSNPRPADYKSAALPA